MLLHNRNLLTDQVNGKLLAFGKINGVTPPAEGWVHAIRSGMKMSLRQLGERLSVTPQSVKELETREKAGTVTLEALEKAGKALNMKLVYGFIPEDGSLNAMIEKRAREVATKIVMRSSMTMKLEDQEIAAEKIERAIDDLTEELKREMPRYLWD